jgi:hypothetical protein
VSETHPEPRSDSAAWWRARRLKIAIGIAVVEGIYVAVASDFSRWTVIIIAAPIIAFYLFAGRTLESPVGREIAWIAAASQALTVLLTVVAKLIGTFSLILAGVFAVVVLILLFGEKPGKTSGKT